MKQHIALIGLSGTGKSTVARLLAARLGWAWADTDALIVAHAGRSIADIFRHEGEPFFRELEAVQVRETAALPTPCVIATGGGVVLRADNRALLCAHAHVIWLDAPSAVLAARLQAHNEQRPLVAGGDAAARIEALRAARAALYRELAEHTIDSASATPAVIAEQIIQLLRR